MGKGFLNRSVIISIEVIRHQNNGAGDRSARLVFLFYRKQWVDLHALIVKSFDWSLYNGSILTLRRLAEGGGVNLAFWPPPFCFSKHVFFRERVKLRFLWLFQIFSQNFIKIPQVGLKIWRFLSSILIIFFSFLDFLTFCCYKETNDVSI